MDFTVFGNHMRDFSQVHPVSLSVAMWVGFFALFGIASENGVIVSIFVVPVLYCAISEFSLRTKSDFYMI